MTAKFRFHITKGEEIRHISHLDYSKAVERALRRAKLPVSYSEGFNPHMKMAFASALSVGVASEAEYLDVEMAAELDAGVVEGALKLQLPPGIDVRRVRTITARHAALMAVVNLASYRAVAPFTGEFSAAAEAVSRFNAAATVPFVKKSPKGRREIDVKTYVGEIGLTRCGGGIELAMDVRITSTGSVKPAEVVAVLADNFGLPVEPDAVGITRTGLFVAGAAGRVTPFEI